MEEISGKAVEVKGLQCEYLTNPIGLDVREPRLSWRIETEEKGWKQKSYRIMAASNLMRLGEETYDIWDSGIVESDETSGVTYNGRKLLSGERCFWKVEVTGEDGRSHISGGTHYWEMGLVEPSDWKAMWIGMGHRSLSGWAPLFRREFILSNEIRSARAYICGLGYYELYLNGQKVGDHVLDPGQTDYEQRVFYVTYDITSSLKTGANAVGVMLGDGFYHQSRVWNREMIYGLPRLLLQLEIEYTDGEKICLVSDQDWKTSYSPITLNNVYAGETYDARLEQAGWDRSGFDDSRWFAAEQMNPPGGRLAAQLVQPIKKMRSVKPVKVTSPMSGIHVFDMGINYAGWVRLTLQGYPGCEVVLRFAETVDKNGMLQVDSCGGVHTQAIQTDKYICKGAGVEVWEPRFTYHGFRYVEVANFPGVPTIDTLEGFKVHTALEERGDFTCSDSRLNKLHELVKNTVTNNIHSIPTDCPVREKCGWLGDAMVMADTIMHYWDSPVFWNKYIEDIETTRQVNGTWMMIAPGRRTCGEAAPAWASSQVQIPWYLYTIYGDRRVLETQYDAMKEWVYYLLGKSQDYIVSYGLDDWCSPGPEFIKGPTLPQISTACFYLSASLTCETAKVLGKKADAEEIGRIASGIEEVFNARFLDREKGSYGSQAVNSFALGLGLVPEGMEQRIADAIARDVKDHDDHLTVGHIGLRYIFQALNDYGYEDVIVKIFQQNTYPSFGHQLENDATSLWEGWEGDTGGSLDHPFKGGFEAWFTSHILGIRAAAPGYREIVIKPAATRMLEHADGYYDSIHGRISSRWKKEGGNLILNVEIPSNTRAKVYIPAREGDAVLVDGMSVEACGYATAGGYENGYALVAVGSGTYEFSCGLLERVEL